MLGKVNRPLSLMSSPELKITVGDLDAGGKHYVFPLRAAWVRGLLEDHEATTAGADGVLDVRASRSGNAIVVHGTLKADLTVPCARCLTPVPVPVEEAVSLLFVPGKTTPLPISAAKKTRETKPSKQKRSTELEEYEISSEDADTFPYDGEVVILDDIVRDELILETPVFPLCSEDCAGMSPPPGPPREPALDIDPRLRPLLRVKTKPD